MFRISGAHSLLIWNKWGLYKEEHELQIGFTQLIGSKLQQSSAAGRAAELGCPIPVNPCTPCRLWGWHSWEGRPCTTQCPIRPPGTTGAVPRTHTLSQHSHLSGAMFLSCASQEYSGCCRQSLELHAEVLHPAQPPRSIYSEYRNCSTCLNFQMNWKIHT